MARPHLVPLRQPDEAMASWVKRAERSRMMLRVLAAGVFATVAITELMIGFSANPLYLFAMLFVIVFVFLASDRVTSAIELAEHEEIWAAVEARQAARRKDSGDTHAE